MQRDIVANLHQIPADVDLVVGIPRSGMLAGSLVALALNLPLADLTGFSEGRVFASGKTRRRAGLDTDTPDFKHALIVDDSYRTGNAMRDAREKLNHLSGTIKLTFCAIYGVSDSQGEIDITMDVVKSPRIFEWNVFHHKILESACIDIDGVLCHDPQGFENDDGVAYLKFLENAPPLHTPSHPLGTLVTSRLEKYRPQTEAWLKKRGLIYRKLVMLDLPDAETRRRLRAHGSFKGDFYKRDQATLFIESELNQAMQIAYISGKPVLSLEGPQMCLPNSISPIAMRQKLRSSYLKVLLQRSLGDSNYEKLKSAIGPRLRRAR